MAVAIAAGAIAFVATHKVRCARCPDDTVWLQREFALTEAQTLAIEKLRAAYEPTCVEHCRQIDLAHAKLASLEKSTPRDEAAHAAARTAWENLKNICHAATQRHIRDIAAQMEPAQGRRYLALVEPKIAGHDHHKPSGSK